MNDPDMPDDVADLQRLAREFAVHELGPAERQLDRMADPAEAFASDAYRKAMAASYHLGLHKLSISADHGGLGIGELGAMVVLEELAAAAPGLASTLLVAPVPAQIIDLFGLAGTHPTFAHYLDAFVADETGGHAGAWAITEPGVGSDIFTLHTDGIGFATRARRGPHGGWRLDGAKSAMVSNGYLADFFLLMAGVEEGHGMEGAGVFLVPGDTPGVTRGRPLDKLGLRALNQAEVYLDGVDIPAEFLIVPPGPGYEMTLMMIVAHGNTAVGVLALGVARAAYEQALAHARERVQGGVAIVHHEAVALSLFRAYRAIEASRSLLWRSARLMEEGRADLPVAIAARTFACEACMQVTADAIQVLGGYGISREAGVEKLYRDAKLLQIMDGTVERVGLLAASLLA